MRQSPVDAVLLAVIAVVLAAGAWQWRQQALRAAKPAPAEEPWQQIQQRYPVPPPVEEALEVPEELLQGITKSNPFSPERRKANQPSETSAADAKIEPEIIPPKFVYKGHVSMGAKQRAIVEDVNTKKTYFLQVGQEVAGSKVLDITSQHVILSDPQSSEPITLTLTPKSTSAQ